MTRNYSKNNSWSLNSLRTNPYCGKEKYLLQNLLLPVPYLPSVHVFNPACPNNSNILMQHHAKCFNETWEMPRSPHFGSEAHITRFPWDYILVPLVILNSVKLNMSTIMWWDEFQQETSVTNLALEKNALLSHTFPQDRTKSVAPQSAWLYGKKVTALKLPFPWNVPLSAYGSSMGFLGYFIQTEIVVSFKSIPLEYEEADGEFCWIWPQVNADAIQAQITLCLNVVFLFCDYFMYVTLTFNFCGHLGKYLSTKHLLKVMLKEHKDQQESFIWN